MIVWLSIAFVVGTIVGALVTAWVYQPYPKLLTGGRKEKH